jgi:molybdopterin molybdotransferase
VISYAEALALVRAEGRARPIGRERVALEGAVGRVVAAPATAVIDHPRFPSSSMDGFALRSADVPGELAVRERIAAGRPDAVAPVGTGECHAIMTGAKLPEGADAVIPVEQVQRLPGERIRISGPVSAGDFVRRAGADYRAGDRVLPAGVAVTADHLLALATLGITELDVVRPPRIVLVTTGAEVVAQGGLLGPTDIHDATGPFLAARLREHGGVVVEHARVGDDPDAFRASVSRALASADLVVSTGAVSMGDHDFVPDVLRALGAEVLFHRVAIRPGKPVLMARVGGLPVLGLPGNPASSAVGFRFFVRPLLDAMAGRAPETSAPAVLLRAYRKGTVPLHHFLRARLGTSDAGVRQVEILPDQASFKVRPFAESDGWALIGEDVTELAEGSLVETLSA